MEEKEEKINKLAKSLRQSGFSTSESSAAEKAKEMVETEEKINESQTKKGFFGRLKEKFSHKEEEPVKMENYDVTEDDRTVNEIMAEAGVSEADANNREEKKDELKEEVTELKKEIEEEKKDPHPGKIEEIKKKEKGVKQDLDVLEEEEGERIDIE